MSRFATFADDLPMALLRFENDKCVYANKRWSKITGRSVESALGDGYLTGVHPEDLSDLKENHLACEDSLEIRHLMPDRSTKWIMWQTAKMSGTDQSVKNI